MIPKKIHYFWFGNNPKGKKEQKCIDSWKKFCPDYEIIEWNESNVDLDMIPFVRQAYDAKKYAFASDVLRLWAIYIYGGVYFDTDVELVKSYDDLLDSEGFIGFENNDYVNTGQCVACEAGNHLIKEVLDCYRTIDFDENDLIPCPKVNTGVFVDHGLKLNGEMQDLDGFKVYPADFFNPYDYVVGKLNKTKNTYSIHWYSKSWMSSKSILRSKLSKPLHRLQRLVGKQNG